MSGVAQFDLVDAYRRIDSGSLDDLLRASAKIGENFWTVIDSSVEFGATVFFSTLRLVKHLALSIFGMLGVFFQSGRAFVIQNFTRMAIDLIGIGIGIVGLFWPAGGMRLTARTVEYLNANRVNFHVCSKEKLRKYEVADGGWIALMAYSKPQILLEGYSD